MKSSSFKSLLTTALALFVASSSFAQKFEGLALTPPMGWNSWNTFATNINEELIIGVADAMIENGMRDAGYVHINLDDGWMMMERDENGDLVPDPEKFPNGLKHLADYLHERGFKFGVYGDAGSKTCAGYPGNMGHEYQDARKYAEWGVDYLKYDWCYTGERNAKEAYTTMRDALYAAGRPVVFSMCEWGTAEPWLWAQDVGHLWRTTGDIISCYDCTQEWSMGWKKILDLQMSLNPGLKGLEEYAGPGHWNDPDMMEVGNHGISLEESRSHFSLWCILAAPLIAGNDVRDMTPEVTAILTNAEAIAINQDPLGKQGTRIYQDDEKEIWIKYLENNDFAVCVLNASDEPRETSLQWEQFQNHFSTWNTNYEIRDIWDAQNIGTTDEHAEVSKMLAPHAVMLYRLSFLEKTK
ncbi:glycoside hydrolase family 27 protein [Pelagicoccus sp. SDUM812003]|uniref:glycoside hydrolase family 27 protein n=1 Tax=Pelagicoccus sp. SDUM812003 TaxID=3041267 RepID=UPI0028107EEE|nr:glycoside hydrolase family 27 protein [Pelagicoccus sp. SDUM812003]MDQ8204449.1 glycoside hydrolase family 27 protein [Pelagicoccus sp. SDUM812003]